MPDTDDNPIDPQLVEAAAHLAYALWHKRSDVGLEAHVAAAVLQQFPAPAAGVAVPTQSQARETHATVVSAVMTRVGELQDSQYLAESDAIDEASQESFPASDPPAWIHIGIDGAWWWAGFPAYDDQGGRAREGAIMSGRRPAIKD